MKNLNTKTLLAASVAALISVNTFAVDDVNATLTVTFAHPQSVAINDASTTTSTTTASADSGGTGTATTWKVTSNNAVKIKFSGASYNTTGGTLTVPILAKQEVNASDKFVAGAYDQLTTEFGIVVTDSSSTQNGVTSWGGGATPKGASGADTTAYGVGTPTNLVSATGTNGPTTTFGAIMPKDDGTFTYTLYTKGTGDTSTTQSGSYTATITTTITAEEKDGSAGTTTATTGG
jgi:hypothetical protein